MGRCAKPVFPIFGSWSLVSLVASSPSAWQSVPKLACAVAISAGSLPKLLVRAASGTAFWLLMKMAYYAVRLVVERASELAKLAER